MTEVITKYGGTLDKYMGDGIMVFFNDPVEYTDHEERAIRTAIEMRDQFYELRSRWYMEGRETINLGDWRPHRLHDGWHVRVQRANAIHRHRQQRESGVAPL